MLKAYEWNRIVVGLAVVVAAAVWHVGGLSWTSQTSCQAFAQQADNWTLLKDQSYGDRAWRLMDVYIPNEEKAENVNGAILFIHGGAWMGGSRGEQASAARAAAAAGYLTGNMEYMLYNDNLEAYKGYKDEYSIDVVMTEIDMALAKLRELGAQHGYDVRRVALSGHSAGGHLTMLYGYTYKTREGGNPPVEVAFIAPRVGPFDFHAKTWNVGKGESAAMAWLVSFMSATNIDAERYLNLDEKTEAAINSISPLHFVRVGVPPTLAAYGGKDSLVPFMHCEKIRDAFAGLGAKSLEDVAADDGTTPVFDLVVFPNSNHDLGSDRDSSRRWHELFLKYATRYLSNSESSTSGEKAR